MAYPDIAGRGDVVVAVDWMNNGTFANWCGATNFKFSIKNELTSTKVGDCDDWGLPIVTKKSPNGQDVTASMDATYAASQHAKTSAWALDQNLLPVEVRFPNSTSGQVEKYEGVAYVSGLDMDGIGNVDGSPITESLALEFSGLVTRVIKA